MEWSGPRMSGSGAVSSEQGKSLNLNSWNIRFAMFAHTVTFVVSVLSV